MSLDAIITVCILAVTSPVWIQVIRFSLLVGDLQLLKIKVRLEKE